MANKRMITGGIWEDEFFTTLSIFARLLWIGLITQCADDQGRLRDSAALIRSNVFPIDDISLKEVEEALQEFYKAGKIDRYKADNKDLIQIVNWWKYQTPRWAGKSNYPPPERWIDRERYHSRNNKIVDKNWNSTGGYIETYIADNTINDVNVNDKYFDDDGDGEEEDEGEPVFSSSSATPGTEPDTELEGINQFTLDEKIEEHELATIYMNVTGNLGLPVKAIDRKTLIEALREIYYTKKDQTAEYLKPFFTAWCDRNYSKMNPGWIDWAIAGEIKLKKDSHLTDNSNNSNESATQRRLRQLRGDQPESASARFLRENMEKYERGISTS